MPTLHRECGSSLIMNKSHGFSRIQVSNHREPPEVGLVKKLTGSLY